MFLALGVSTLLPFLVSHVLSNTCVLTSPACSLFTGAIPEEQLLSCGASDCLMATVPTNGTQRPSQELIYTLLGIYTGMSVRRGSGPSPSRSQIQLLPVSEKTLSPEYK